MKELMKLIKQFGRAKVDLSWSGVTRDPEQAHLNAIKSRDEALEKIKDLFSWFKPEDYTRVGPCWIAYKGREVTAYRNQKGTYLFSEHSENCYLKECIVLVAPLFIPELKK